MKEEILRQEPLDFKFKCPNCSERIDVADLPENDEAIRDIINTIIKAYRDNS